jgi:hypothetical protein
MTLAFEFTAETIGDPARFWALVDRRGPAECWLWQGRLGVDGYGRIIRYVDRKRRDFRAPRVAYVLSVRPLAADEVVDHLCRTPRCVNPAHLEATSTQVNTARGVGPTAAHATARLSGMCINGHDLAAAGTHKQRNGETCAQCGRDRVRRYKERKQRHDGETDS